MEVCSRGSVRAVPTVVDEAPEGIVSWIATHEHQAFEPGQWSQGKTKLNERRPLGCSCGWRQPGVLGVSPFLGLRTARGCVETLSEVKVVSPFREIDSVGLNVLSRQLDTAMPEYDVGVQGIPARRESSDPVGVSSCHERFRAVQNSSSRCEKIMYGDKACN